MDPDPVAHAVVGSSGQQRAGLGERSGKSSITRAVLHSLAEEEPYCEGGPCPCGCSDSGSDSPTAAVAAAAAEAPWQQQQLQQPLQPHGSSSSSDGPVV